MIDTGVSAYFTSMRRITIIILSFLIACTKAPPGSNPDYIEAVNFTFLQELNQLYFSVSLSSTASNPDTVFIEWFGLDISNEPDTLPLYDDGTNGDILSGDNVWTIEIENSADTLLSHPIQQGSSGTVYCTGKAISGSSEYSLDGEFSLGNIIPRIVSITAPDSVNLPPSSTVTTTFLVTCEVFDANGPDDIRRVSFKSYFAENDSAMNDGIAFEMADDGVKYNSGDVTAGDQIYSVTVILPVTAKLGTYLWVFQAQDNSFAYSLRDSHYITVEPYNQ